jgi:hypothetical protein
MQSKELYPRVMVFENAIENPKEFLKQIINSEHVRPWEPWYTLGKQTFFTQYPHIKTEKFPTKQQWDEVFGTNTNPLAKQTSDLFYECTNQYVQKYGVDIQNWSHGAPYLLTHEAKTPDKVLAMQYHTDFIMSQTNNPGYKHWLTCLVYVNDDYEGGEIAFKVFKNDDDYDHFVYKPKAGDVLICPAHPPYYHGVHRTKTNYKAFIRLFWGYDYEGSPEWLANQEKYGKEEWDRMEKERLDIEFRTSKWMKGAVEEI